MRRRGGDIRFLRGLFSFRTKGDEKKVMDLFLSELKGVSHLLNKKEVKKSRGISHTKGKLNHQPARFADIFRLLFLENTFFRLITSL